MRQHIMKQPNLQELGCLNAKKSRVAFVTSFVTSKHVTNTTAILYNSQISSLIECKEIDALILCMPSSSLGRSFSTRFRNGSSLSAQFVAVGPSMC